MGCILIVVIILFLLMSKFIKMPRLLLVGVVLRYAEGLTRRSSFGQSRF
jgi:hypothetical protein